jgi:hypothetical protein
MARPETFLINMGGGEILLGEVSAVAKLALGTERLRLLITDSRIIVAHIGKRGGGALALSALFGMLSGALEDFFKTSRESVMRKKTNDPAEILAADRDNFAIAFNEVVSTHVDERPGLTSITVLTAQDKFEFFTSAGVENVAGLLRQTLSEKLTITRL